MSWSLIGDGNPSDQCGSPKPYHVFFDGVPVWGPTQCGRRQCPLCCDRRYIIDAADDITRTLMGVVASLIADGRLYDEKGRSLKIFHYYYSRCEKDEDVKKARKTCKDVLKRHGMLGGYSILHPHRGSHDKKATPKQCRDAMDRSHLSIHIHGVAIGYWSTPAEKGCNYHYHSNKLVDIREWIDTESPIDLRRKLLGKLEYDLGHAGYYGERGQSVSYFGPHRLKSHVPPRPDIALKHPSMEMDGEPIWEKRVIPDPESWEKLRWMREDFLNGDYAGTTFGEYLKSDTPWYALEDVEREEWHDNWYFWRIDKAKLISKLMHQHHNPSMENFPT